MSRGRKPTRQIPQSSDEKSLRARQPRQKVWILTMAATVPSTSFVARRSECAAPMRAARAPRHGKRAAHAGGTHRRGGRLAGREFGRNAAEGRWTAVCAQILLKVISKVQL